MYMILEAKEGAREVQCCPEVPPQTKRTIDLHRRAIIGAVLTDSTQETRETK